MRRHSPNFDRVLEESRSVQQGRDAKRETKRGHIVEPLGVLDESRGDDSAIE